MNRLFFRFFLLVMLSITVATFIIYVAINLVFGDPLEDIARRQASAQIFLLEQYVDQAPPDEWLTRLNKVREVSKVNLELIPLHAAKALLDPAQHMALERGEVVLLPASRAFFRRVDLTGNAYIGSDGEVIHARDLPIDISLAVQMEALRYIIVALALLIPIALWSRAHWMALQHLSDVARRVGDGELSARALLAPGDSVYPLAEHMNNMAARIERLIDAQKNLMHSVAHELRTPIARLEFALELLRDRTSDPALEKRIDAMAGDVTELNDLVGELLGMIRLDSAGGLDAAAFDLAAALRTSIASLGQPVDEHIADLGMVQGERRLLLRAFDNLLRNAQKYADRHIAVTAERMLDGSIEISVEDDGPGIPQAERDRIFEPFYRLDRSRDRASGGFGLGLSIAHKAVALHGGSIKVGQSNLGGASMTIVLPAIQPAS